MDVYQINIEYTDEAGTSQQEKLVAPETMAVSAVIGRVTEIFSGGFPDDCQIMWRKVGALIADVPTPGGSGEQDSGAED